jgi:hypothetical protein
MTNETPGPPDNGAIADPPTPLLTPLDTATSTSTTTSTAAPPEAPDAPSDGVLTAHAPLAPSTAAGAPPPTFIGRPPLHDAAAIDAFENAARLAFTAPPPPRPAEPQPYDSPGRPWYAAPGAPPLSSAPWVEGYWQAPSHADHIRNTYGLGPSPAPEPRPMPSWAAPPPPPPSFFEKLRRRATYALKTGLAEAGKAWTTHQLLEQVQAQTQAPRQVVVPSAAPTGSFFEGGLLTIGFDSVGEIEPGQTVDIPTLVLDVFQGVALSIPRPVATSVLINNILVGMRSQLVGRAPISGETYVPEDAAQYPHRPQFLLDCAQIGQSITLTVKNIGQKPIRFTATMYGRAAR